MTKKQSKLSARILRLNIGKPKRVAEHVTRTGQIFDKIRRENENKKKKKTRIPKKPIDIVYI